MAVMKILRAKTDGILRQKANDVVKIDVKIKALLDDMADTLNAVGGLGLAAPQVGASLRLFVVKNGADIIKFVNPVLVSLEGEQISTEACLSLPGLIGRVKRPAKVLVRAQNELGKTFDLCAMDRLACTLSHETDHLDGILYTDRAFQTRRLKPSEV